MSVHFSSWVWRHSNSQGSDLVLLLALADMTNDEGECWPSIGTLAKRCRCDERTVYRLIAAARDLGLITVENRSRDGKSNIYRIITGPSPDNSVSPSPVTDVATPPVTDVRLNHHKRTVIEEPPNPLAGGNGAVSAAPRKNGKLTVESVIDNVRFDLTLHQSLPFRAAWKRWVVNRLQLPKATLGAFTAQMTICARLGERRAIAAIDHSIANSWASIFEEKQILKRSTKPEPSL